MPTDLTTFSEKPSHLQEVELDGETYKVRFVWFKRVNGGGSWYMSLYDEEENGIWLNRRLVPLRILAQHVLREGQPPGQFLVRGPADYRRETLGDELIVRYYSKDEIKKAEPERNFEIY